MSNPVMNKNDFPIKKAYEMTTDGVLESRAPVTAGEAEAKRKKIKGQTHVVNHSMPQLAAEPGTEQRCSISWSRSSLSLAVRPVSTLRCLCSSVTAGQALSAGEHIFIPNL